MKDIHARLSDDRFQAQYRIKAWFSEGETFNPLMTAVFHAVAMLAHARRPETETYGKDFRINYPRIPIV